MVMHEKVLGVMSQINVSGGNRNLDPHANSLAHYPLDLFKVVHRQYEGVFVASSIHSYGCTSHQNTPKTKQQSIF